MIKTTSSTCGKAQRFNHTQNVQEEMPKINVLFRSTFRVDGFSIDNWIVSSIMNIKRIGKFNIVSVSDSSCDHGTVFLFLFSVSIKNGLLRNGSNVRTIRWHSVGVSINESVQGHHESFHAVIKEENKPFHVPFKWALVIRSIWSYFFGWQLKRLFCFHFETNCNACHPIICLTEMLMKMFFCRTEVSFEMTWTLAASLWVCVCVRLQPKKQWMKQTYNFWQRFGDRNKIYQRKNFA